MRHLTHFAIVLTILENCHLVAAFTSTCTGSQRTRPATPTLAIRRSESKLQSIPTPLDTLTSGLASICRLPFGVTVSSDATNIPEEEKPILLRLYDIENNSECRKVRERITELDLNIEAVVPSASNSRATLDSNYEYALHSNKELPTLIVQDASFNQLTLSGAQNILDYLNDKFNVEPEILTESAMDTAMNILHKVGNEVATFLRIGRGQQACGAAGPLAPRPREPLILYDYSGNQFSRLVREVLMELDIVYSIRSVGKSSPRRSQMAEETGGSTQCPHLIDPNTDVSISESKDIIQYLYDTYALYTPPPEILEFMSSNLLYPIKPLVAQLAKIQAGAANSEQGEYEKGLDAAESEIRNEVSSAPVVVYTYDLSPFTFEIRSILQRMNVEFTEISMGKEWMPGFIAPGGSEKRAALLRMTGQSSLPHLFVGGESLGGLYTGTPGLIPSLEQGNFQPMVDSAMRESTAKLTPGTSLVAGPATSVIQEEEIGDFQ